MNDSSSYKIGSNLSILLVGDPKTGKTGVSASFPDPYWLDVDRNLDSAIRVIGGKKFWYDQPTVDLDATGKKIRDVPEDEVWPRSLAMLKVAVAHPEIKTIIVDSFSQLAGYARAALLKKLKDIGAVDQKGKPLDNLRLSDYLTLLDWFRAFVFALRSSGKFVVVTSHQQVTKDELTGANHYSLAIPGQSKDSFGGWFTDVWATTATPIAMGKTKFEIRTRPTGFHVSLGTSIRSLPAAIDITDKDPAAIWSLLSPTLSVTPVTK